jgi:alanine racemase
MRNLWCEIDVDRIEENIKKIRENTDKKLMAVIKAGAYGFGIEEISSLIDESVDFFAVSNVEEARRVKSQRDILILYPVMSEWDIENIRDNFILTLDEPQIFEKLKASGKNFRAHIYVDTGMNRFGVKPENLKEFIELIEKDYPEITIEGLYTHLHNTKDEAYTLRQIEVFEKIAEQYREKVKYIHLLNSNGFVKYNSKCCFDNVVRVGNLIYGYDAAAYGYRKIYSYKAEPLRVYTVNTGEYIGYGCYYRAKKPVRVGILDMGYIDNFNCSRNIKNNIFYDIAKTIYYHFKYYSGIFYKGRMVHIIGKPNMNFTLVDMEGMEDNAVLDIDMSSITADSSIPKRFRRGENYVQF